MKTLKEQLEQAKVALGFGRDESDRPQPKSGWLSVTVIYRGDKTYYRCPECGCPVKKGRFARHMQQVHETCLDGVAINEARHVVKAVRDKTKRHAKKDSGHPQRLKAAGVTRGGAKPEAGKKSHSKPNGRTWTRRRTSSAEESQSARSRTPRMSRAEAAQKRAALNDQRLVSDKKIADYLRRNPTENQMGKFGVPQDPFRHGFYGSATMEYDVWRRGE